MRLRLATVSWLAIALAGATATHAQFAPPLRGTIPQAERAWPRPDTPAMSFRLGRRVGQTSCGIDCAEFIVAEGDIRSDSADQLLALTARLTRPLPVYFNSPGGSLEGGLMLGRVLRKLGLPVLVGQRAPLPCTPATGCSEADERAGIAVFSEARLAATCNSACVYTFAGGTTRGLLPGSTLGIHQFYVAHADDPARTPKANYSREDFAHLQRTVSVVAAYLEEMGVSIDLLARAAAVDAGAIRRLSLRETAELRLTTPDAPPTFAARNGAPSRPMPAPSASRTVAALEPDRAASPWPVVTREGRPFVVMTAPSLSRRFGDIANEIAIGCPIEQGRYTASFREILPLRPDRVQDAEVIVGSISAGENLTRAQSISREAAQIAAQRGSLQLEVTSTATAGYPMRIDVPGDGLKAALERLEAACTSR